MLSGAEALTRGLVAAGVRVAYAHPGEGVFFEAPGGALTRRAVLSERVAVSLALGGALLDGSTQCALLGRGGLKGELDLLSGLGQLNELRAPLLLVEAGAEDDRAALAEIARLPVLEPSDPEEIYQLTRLAAQASRRGGLPVVLRISTAALAARGGVQESPPDAQEGGHRFARSAGPYLNVSASAAFHVAKRMRRLTQLEGLIEALCVATEGQEQRAVVVAPSLGAAAQARAQARRLPSLRLGASWPLPRRALLELLTDRSQVLVLEEGEGFLQRALQVFAHAEGLPCRVVGLRGGRAAKLDPERLERALEGFAGSPSTEVEPGGRPASAWQAAVAALAAIGPDPGEPWPLHEARLHVGAPDPLADPRSTLCGALRQLERAAIVVSGPGSCDGGLSRTRQIDVLADPGVAASLAGALAEASAVEEREGEPLAVALMADTELVQSGLAGVIDNALQRREVLHVLLAGRGADRGQDGGASFSMPVEVLEAQLRAAGLHVTTAWLDDPKLVEVAAYAASRLGPRALICVARSSAPSVSSAPSPPSGGDRG